MGGILGIGVSGAESGARNNLNNVFNYGLDTSKSGVSRGYAAGDAASRSYGNAADVFRSLITGGRPQAAINAAPAINASIASTDAAKREAAETGSGRTGGDTAANAEAGATSRKTIDDILNENLFGGKIAGAQGLAGVGQGEANLAGTNLSSAANFLGLGTKAMGDVLDSGMAETAARERLGSSLGMGLAKALTLFG